MLVFLSFTVMISLTPVLHADLLQVLMLKG